MKKIKKSVAILIGIFLMPTAISPLVTVTDEDKSEIIKNKILAKAPIPSRF
jgi:hypothetical protein